MVSNHCQTACLSMHSLAAKGNYNGKLSVWMTKLNLCLCSALQHRQMDILKPLGLAPEDVKLPLSPRSEDAYARINEEFDMLYSQLQDPGEQPGQNQLEVSSP